MITWLLATTSGGSDDDSDSDSDGDSVDDLDDDSDDDSDYDSDYPGVGARLGSSAAAERAVLAAGQIEGRPPVELNHLMC